MYALDRRPIRIVLSLAVALAAFSSSATKAVESAQFGVVADIHAHDTDSPLEGKWTTSTAKRLASFTKAMSAWSPEFVIELGDFVNGWGVFFGAEPGHPGRIPEGLAWTERVYEAFDGPRYHVLGSHDVCNLDKPTYLDVLRIEATNYGFVVLNVQFAPDGADLGHTYTGVWRHLPETEWAWLRDDLAASRRTTLVFVHQMPNGYIEAWGRELVLNAPAVREALAEGGDVIAAFRGHDHDSHLPAHRRDRLSHVRAAGRPRHPGPVGPRDPRPDRPDDRRRRGERPGKLPKHVSGEG